MTCSQPQGAAMHELSICAALVSEIARLAADRNALAVKSVRLSIGPLSGIDAIALAAAFPITAAQTPCAHAQLLIDAVPLTVRCNTCSATTEAELHCLVCAACGDTNTTLICGDQMLLSGVELVVEGG